MNLTLVETSPYYLLFTLDPHFQLFFGKVADGKIALVGYCESTLVSKILKLKKAKYKCIVLLRLHDKNVFCFN